MEEMLSENAKISDSGYSNTGSNSQSYTSSEKLRKPIGKWKDKVYKQKKSKVQIRNNVRNNIPVSFLDPCSWSSTEPCDSVLCQTTEERPVVELVDATDPGIHNGYLTTSSEADIASKTRQTTQDFSSSIEDNYAVVSMHDGLVLHATPSLCASLGYPTDWWTGKLFVDFIDPRDKHPFLDRIVSEIASSKDFHPSGVSDKKASIFCRMRRFNFCSSSKKNQCIPYQMNLAVKKFHKDEVVVSKSEIMLLVILFKPVYSAYKVPEEIIIPRVFATHHTATCTLSYVDPEIVQYLGYLPQDMINHSLFDFYYPEDLPLIKEIYKIVINLESKSYRSKPYRFITQNGSLVVLETEWSCFVNPWTKNVEFIVGHHRIQKGPADPNIFRPPGNRKKDLLAGIGEQVMKDAKVIQKEIISLLEETVQKRSPFPSADLELLTKKKELTSFAKFILQKINSQTPIKDQLAMDFSDHDSVVLGEISPHHEYLDSKSSTPPSYNQLNYRDNINRFFSRNEKNLPSSENSSDELGKNNISGPEMEGTFSTNESGNSGSAESLNSDMINQQSFSSRGETSNTVSNNQILLTKTLLNKHNEDMEKLMVQNHRKQKKDDKRNKSLFPDTKVKVESSAVKCDANNRNRNELKRSAIPNRDIDNTAKIPKYDNSEKAIQNIQTMVEPKSVLTKTDAPSNTNQENLQINSWSCNSMAMTPTTTIMQQCLSTTNTCFQGVNRSPGLPQVFSVYYLPVQKPRDNPPPSNIHQENLEPANSMNQSLSYFPCVMPNVMYSPIVGPSTSNAMMYSSFPSVAPDVAATSTPLNNIPATTAPPTAVNISFDLERSPSPTTSYKMSESSKKNLSSSGIISSSASNEDVSITDDSTTNNTKDSYAKNNKVNDFSFFSNSLNKHLSANSDAKQWYNESSTEEQNEKNKESHINQVDKPFGMRRKEPPWIEGIQLSSELIYQYQIEPKPLNDVLKTDLEFLSQSKQSNLVNDQLGQLFLDLDLQGLNSNMLLDDFGISNVIDDGMDGSHSLDDLNSCLEFDEPLSTAPRSLQEEPNKNLCGESSVHA